MPPTASVLRNGIGVQVTSDDLFMGDRMMLRLGERASTDGVIQTGHTILRLSTITGETVHAEAINGGGVIEVEITVQALTSSLARIAHIIEVGWSDDP